ncbi:hypothetical protein M3650_02035 [Paenibacillus sp. MER TA 81-3]|uniref:phosphotransferase n=1 Tax=Paenibacillus sp. MER TA 81-3 TaxID=2939573 RepID=UPI00203B078C|nr:phosphotransferase [Paenibacillus sp. MER TA 81-3]MCM3337462.1 hypothetical protein [Paenibacillus sp. MER TA 81-3]
MSHAKPSLTITDVHAVLERHWRQSAENVSAIEGGNFSSVFSFKIEHRDYVIHFSDAVDTFQTEHYVADILSSQDVLYPKTFGRGEDGPFRYCISERIKGSVVADLQAKQKIELLPDLVRVITDMNQIQLDSTTTDFGPLIPSGNGAYDAWESFLLFLLSIKEKDSS